MAKTSTIAELHRYLSDLIEQGHGDAPVLFDTEARTFDYHMAAIGNAYFEEVPYPHLGLHEKRYTTPNEPVEN